LPGAKNYMSVTEFLGTGGTPTLVALVDDDAPLRAALAFDLSTAGFEVSAFADAESAREGDPARWRCLITDLRLPGMSGLDLAESLRRDGQNTPAILITTNPSRAVRFRAQAASVEIVEKPLLNGTLVESIRRVLRSA